MAASLIGGGDVAGLMDSSYMLEAPQVHLHFLSTDEEEREQGYGRFEICCHGCGESLLVLYVDTGHHRKYVRIRDDFLAQHRKCPDRGYKSLCPSHRSACRVADLRPSGWRKRTATPVLRKPMQVEMFMPAVPQLEHQERV